MAARKREVGRETAGGIASGHDAMQPAGLEVAPVVGGEIGPQEERRGRRRRIAGILAGDLHQRGAALVELAIAHQRASRLIGRERGQRLRLTHQLELHRGFAVPPEPGQCRPVGKTVFAGAEACRQRAGKAADRPRRRAPIPLPPGPRSAPPPRRAGQRCCPEWRWPPAAALPGRAAARARSSRRSSGPGRAIGRRGQSQAEARETVAGGGVAPGGSLQVAGPLVRAGLGPGNPAPGERVGDPA